MFTTFDLAGKLQRRLRKEGEEGFTMWARDYERTYGSPKEAREIVQKAPFSDELTYQLIHDAGLEFMRRPMDLRAASRIARFEEVFTARIVAPDEGLDLEELKDVGLRLSLYSGAVAQPAFRRLGRFHVAVEHVRRLTERFNNPQHRDVLGAQAYWPEHVRFMLLGPAISGLAYWI